MRKFPVDSGPADPTVPLLADPPDGAAPWPSLGGPEEVHVGMTHYYRCDHCGGWVEGCPRARREDAMGILSGRRGTAYDCIRCGNEVGFSGMMA